MRTGRHDLFEEPLAEAMAATEAEHHGEVRRDQMTDIRIDAPGVVLCELSPLARLCDVPGAEGHAHFSPTCSV